MFGKNIVRDNVLESENQSWSPSEPSGSYYQAVVRYEVGIYYSNNIYSRILTHL